jgi:hypothetical protein
MEWTDARDTLTPTKINYKNLYYKPVIGGMDRNKILKGCNYTCRTCGGVYKTYLMLSYVLKDDCYDMYCNACHIITHLNIGLPKGIDVYSSKLSQLDIIKKTVDYIVENNRMPKLQDIDPKIEDSPISLFEYVNLLDHIDSQFADCKIFFNGDFNITFITNNYGSINPFVDGDDTVGDEIELNVHKLSENDDIILKKLFYK